MTSQRSPQPGAVILPLPGATGPVVGLAELDAATAATLAVLGNPDATAADRRAAAAVEESVFAAFERIHGPECLKAGL
jgi:hypothetical protein